ncbi:MAG: DEAD/DEAH box helicase, partial [Rhodococcus sp. (in: high G+C Gram-positive bacteria)]
MRARREDTRKAETLSKITVDHENDSVAETTVSATLDTTHTPPTFAELGVHPEIVRGLSDIGIERTFAIQELTLPLALAGDDLIGQARTGMGKTYGFGVPLLHRLATGPADGSGTTTLDGTPRALIIVPTRELCVQVTSDLENASKHLHSSNGRVKVMSIYGGRPYEAQIETLRTGVDVVVGTPGRLLDLAKQGHLVLGKVGVLVLDEADEMLDLGFLPDIERLMGMVPDKRQTMLFSATMPGPIITLARTFLTQPTHIRAEEAESSAIHERTAQHVFRAHALDKAEMVARVLQADGRGATMIFTRTKRTAQKVADDLAERGFAVGAVHGDLGQVAREKSLNAFRNGKIDVLVATDVAARGIDIDDVTHVINYQCPEDEKTYVHRIGRTGRAGRTGIAVTLVDWDDIPRWQLIDKALGLDIPDPVETYSSSDHLYSELDIPRGTTGSIASPKSSKPAASAKTGSGQAADSDQDGAKRDGDEAPRSTPRRNRSRRRTRGGNSDAGTSTPDTSGSEVTGSDTKGSDTKGSDDSPSERPRRRRRRRPSAGSAA